MTILKEFEEALREQGMDGALAVLEKLKERQRAKRSVTPARRMTERNMTTELAQQVLTLLRHTLERMQENQHARLHRECTPTKRKILMVLDSLYRVTE